MFDVIVFANPHVVNTNVQVATGDGTTKTFDFVLPNNSAVAGTVVITSGTVVATDHGDGTFTGSTGVSGTINYATGEVVLTYTTAPAAGAITGSWTGYDQSTTTNDYEIAQRPVVLGVKSESSTAGRFVIVGTNDGVKFRTVADITLAPRAYVDLGLMVYGNIIVISDVSARLTGKAINPYK